jgi:hypothetical protein
MFVTATLRSNSLTREIASEMAAVPVKCRFTDLRSRRIIPRNYPELAISTNNMTICAGIGSRNDNRAGRDRS